MAHSSSNSTEEVASQLLLLRDSKNWLICENLYFTTIIHQVHGSWHSMWARFADEYNGPRTHAKCIQHYNNLVTHLNKNDAFTRDMFITSIKRHIIQYVDAGIAHEGFWSFSKKLSNTDVAQNKNSFYIHLKNAKEILQLLGFANNILTQPGDNVDKWIFLWDATRQTLIPVLLQKKEKKLFFARTWYMDVVQPNQLQAHQNVHFKIDSLMGLGCIIFSSN